MPIIIVNDSNNNENTIKPIESYNNGITHYLSSHKEMEDVLNLKVYINNYNTDDTKLIGDKLFFNNEIDVLDNKYNIKGNSQRDSQINNTVDLHKLDSKISANINTVKQPTQLQKLRFMKYKQSKLLYDHKKVKGFLVTSNPSYHKRRTTRFPLISDNQLPDRDKALDLAIQYTETNVDKIAEELFNILKMFNKYHGSKKDKFNETINTNTDFWSPISSQKQINTKSTNSPNRPISKHINFSNKIDSKVDSKDDTKIESKVENPILIPKKPATSKPSITRNYKLPNHRKLNLSDDITYTNNNNINKQLELLQYTQQQYKQSMQSTILQIKSTNQSINRLQLKYQQKYNNIDRHVTSLLSHINSFNRSNNSNYNNIDYLINHKELFKIIDIKEKTMYINTTDELTSSNIYNYINHQKDMKLIERLDRNIWFINILNNTYNYLTNPMNQTLTILTTQIVNNGYTNIPDSCYRLLYLFFYMIRHNYTIDSNLFYTLLDKTVNKNPLDHQILIVHKIISYIRDYLNIASDKFLKYLNSLSIVPSSELLLQARKLKKQKLLKHKLKHKQQVNNNNKLVPIDEDTIINISNNNINNEVVGKLSRLNSTNVSRVPSTIMSDISISDMDSIVSGDYN